MKKITHVKKTITKVEESDVPEIVTEEVEIRSKKAFPWKYVAAAGIVIVVAGVLGFMKRNRDQMVNLRTKVIPETVMKLVGDPTVKITEVRNLKETSGIYEFELVLDTAGTVKNYTSYITKDGQLFFSQGTKLKDLASVVAPTPKKTMTCDDIPKEATAKVTAFVVSNCPYGLQMQRVMSKAIGEQKELEKTMDVKYIGSIVDGKVTSMHGEEEAIENTRQICIREEQKPKYWEYVSCYMKEAGKSEACMATSGVDVSAVQTCMTDPNKGVAYAKKDFDLSTTLNIGSSPTLLVNDKLVVSEFDFGGRTADAMKNITCCASSTKAGYCGTALSTEQAAASFSVTGTGGTTSAASCATQ